MQRYDKGCRARNRQTAAVPIKVAACDAPTPGHGRPMTVVSRQGEPRIRARMT